VSLPFAACDRPNAVWCIDFKGKFRTQDGTWCHVLTLVDTYSRFLLRAEVLVDPTGRNVERVLDAAVGSQLLWTLPSQNHSPLASCRRMTVDHLPIPSSSVQSFWQEIA
jgi:transposase InsO family protein